MQLWENSLSHDNLVTSYHLYRHRDARNTRSHRANVISTHNIQQSSSPFITTNCVKLRGFSSAKIHKVLIMLGSASWFIICISWRKHHPLSVLYFRGVEVRDSHQNLSVEPVLSNLSCDKAGITVDSRIAGSCGGRKRGRSWRSTWNLHLIILERIN